MANGAIQALTNDAGEIAVKSPDGKVGFVPKADIDAAQGQGFVPLTPGQFEQARQAKEFDAPVTAAALGAARGFTLGLSDLALSGRGQFEADKLREFNPIASGVGEAGGAVASALVPGVGVLGAAGKAAGGAAARFAATAGRSGGLATRIAQRALPVGAQAVTEGGLIGAGQGVSQVALEPGSVGAGKAAGVIARRALEGAVVDAGVSLGFMGLGAVAKGAGRVVAKVGELGKRQTKAGRAAESLLKTVEAGETQASGLARHVQLETQRADQMAIMAAIRRKRAAGVATGEELALLSEMQVAQRSLGAEKRAIEKEISGQAKRAPKTTKTTTTTERVGWAQQQRAASDDVVRAIDRGELLTAQQRLTALEPEAARLRRLEDELNVAIGELRNTRRAGLRAGEDLTGESDQLAAVLFQQRGVVRSQLSQHEGMVKAINRGAFAKSGADIRQVFEGMPAERLVRRAETVIERGAQQAQKVDLPTAPLTDLAQHRQGVLQSLAAERTGGELNRFAQWRSAAVLLGFSAGDFGGAFIGALAGVPAVQRALSSTLRGTLGGMQAGAIAVARGADVMRVATAVPLIRSTEDVEAFAESAMLPGRDPESIRLAALQGYQDAGLPPAMATTLADYQAGRAEAIRDAIPQDPRNPVQRQRLTRTIEAAENPRSITTRLKNGSLRDEDISVMRKSMPQVYAVLSAQARRILAGSTKGMPPQTKRMIQKLAGQGAVVAAQVQALQQPPDPPPQGQPRGGHVPNQSTATQSAATLLAG